MSEVWGWESPSLLLIPSYLLVGGIEVCVGVVFDLLVSEMGGSAGVVASRGVGVHGSVWGAFPAFFPGLPRMRGALYCLELLVFLYFHAVSPRCLGFLLISRS